MTTYTCLITDSRYSVPSLSFYVAADLDTMRRMAREDLRANPNHEVFEVRNGDALIFVERRREGAHV